MSLAIFNQTGRRRSLSLLSISVRHTSRALASTGDAVVNNGLKTAARRSHCSVPDGIQVDQQSPARGQPFQAAQHESRPPFRFFGIIEPQIWQVAQ
jgi:hypothetical protein